MISDQLLKLHGKGKVCLMVMMGMMIIIIILLLLLLFSSLLLLLFLLSFLFPDIKIKIADVAGPKEHFTFPAKSDLGLLYPY